MPSKKTIYQRSLSLYNKQYGRNPPPPSYSTDPVAFDEWLMQRHQHICTGVDYVDSEGIYREACFDNPCTQVSELVQSIEEDSSDFELEELLPLDVLLALNK